MLVRTIQFGLATALFFISAVAYGHRFHAGITDISMNPTTGNTEIVHTFMAHDVEALLENLYQRQFDLSDAEDVLLFKKYFEKQFSISDQTTADQQNSRLKIKWVGAKVDPNYVIVFQEIERQYLPTQITIQQAVLTDFLSDQVNTININLTTGVRSLSFTRHRREQSFP
jgi:hypothetical protein